MSAYKHDFFAALRNDFNTPAALAAMDGWIREANRRAEGVGDGDLREMLGVLGLGELTPLQSADAAGEDPEAMALLQERERARCGARLRGRRPLPGSAARAGMGGARRTARARS